MPAAKTKKAPAKEKAPVQTDRTLSPGTGVYLAPRDDNDVIFGHFCRVTEGEHEGLYGVYEDNATLGDDGYPETVLVRTRDDDSRLITVPYSSIARDRAGRR